MPISVTCPACSVDYKVPDNVAGKKIKCPKCKGAVIRVPAEDGQPATLVSTGDASSHPSAAEPSTAGTGSNTSSHAAATEASPAATSTVQDAWQMKTEEGEVYGPVPKAELDEWVNEGRVSARSQLLQAGKKQWQWAGHVYPQLTQVSSNSPQNQQAASGQQQAVSPQFQQASTQPGFGQTGMQQQAMVSQGQFVAPQQQIQRPANATRYIKGQSDKSKVAAGLLGLFLGAYGAHNFYLGKTGLGLAQLLISLLTCFIGTIVTGPWALIETIMIFTGSITDAEGRPLKD